MGNLYSFVLTALLAKELGATIMLRIDDIDQERYRPEYLLSVFEILHYFNLPWQEGPADAIDFEKNWSQHQRLPYYLKALDELKKQQLVYACLCTRADQQSAGLVSGCVKQCKPAKISLEQPGVNWRFCTPDSAQELWVYPDQKQVFPFPDTLKDFIVRKKDGNPAYQLCSVVDDQLFGVGLVVRGFDLLPSSIAQVALSKHISPKYAEGVRYFHHRLLLQPESGRKLSKSTGSDSLYQMVQAGKTAGQILNKLADQCGFRVNARNWTDLVCLLR